MLFTKLQTEWVILGSEIDIFIWMKVVQFLVKITAYTFEIFAYIYFHVTKVEQSQSKINFFILWEKSGPFPSLLFIATSMLVLAINGSELAKIELLTVHQLAMMLWFYKTCLSPLFCYKKAALHHCCKSFGMLTLFHCFIGTKLEDRWGIVAPVIILILQIYSLSLFHSCDGINIFRKVWWWQTSVFWTKIESQILATLYIFYTNVIYMIVCSWL